MNEIWKDIPGYEGLYKISNKGNIYSCKRDKNIIVHVTQHYPICDLYKNGKRKTCYIHRLIAQSFIDNEFDKPEINHIDGNKLNNDIKNLEWVTHKENGQHALKTGLMKSNGNEIPVICLTLNVEKYCIAEMGRFLNNRYKDNDPIKYENGVRSVISGRTKLYKGLYFQRLIK